MRHIIKDSFGYFITMMIFYFILEFIIKVNSFDLILILEATLAVAIINAVAKIIYRQIFIKYQHENAERKKKFKGSAIRLLLGVTKEDLERWTEEKRAEGEDPAKT
ncbi:hypothetical protein [Marininema halotolerans]|uniref:Uncharacterized protein n=1 Tax=Marininema halotolerans TaxID=1155944 RepID=A0A1I6SHB5_9BACL|nr:hypothetical protein [Marininema halotolerans]SFS76327.1 hypothetical protein SAMN05444972_10790 [Marininema halotolerans]